MKLWTTKRSCFETKWKLRASTSDSCTSNVAHIPPAFIFSALHTAKQDIFYIYVQCVLCRKIIVFPCGFDFFLTLTQPNPLWWGSFLPTCDYFGKWPPSFFLLLFLCECFLATILLVSLHFLVPWIFGSRILQGLDIGVW